MILQNSEITKVSSLEAVRSSWERTILLNDQAMKWVKARVFVYSDSVLCSGGSNSPDDANRRWEEQVSALKMYSTFTELQGLDGEPINFERTDLSQRDRAHRASHHSRDQAKRKLREHTGLSRAGGRRSVATSTRTPWRSAAVCGGHHDPSEHRFPTSTTERRPLAANRN